MNLSLVIPLLNEQESLPELHEWLVSVMKKNNFSYEILFIDDGSTDDSWQIIENLSQANSNVKGIRFLRNYGKSQALHAGFARAKGDVVITMDADLQDSPDEIPELYRLIMEDNYDLISGWKKKRYDPITKTIPTKLYNATNRLVSGIKLHDMNCGLKAYKNVEDEVILWGQVGVPSDIHIGKGAVVLGQSGITKDLEGGKTYFGSPAEEARSKFRELALIRKLPKAIETLGL